MDNQVELRDAISVEVYGCKFKDLPVTPGGQRRFVKRLAYLVREREREAKLSEVLLAINGLLDQGNAGYFVKRLAEIQAVEKEEP